MAEETGPTSHAHVKLCGHIDERESKAMMEDSNQSSSLELFSFVAYATRDRKACHRHHVLHRLHALYCNQHKYNGSRFQCKCLSISVETKEGEYFARLVRGTGWYEACDGSSLVPEETSCGR